MKGIQNNKSPNNDRLTKEFFEIYEDELKDSYKFNEVSLLKKALSTSQHQVGHNKMSNVLKRSKIT